MLQLLGLFSNLLIYYLLTRDQYAYGANVPALQLPDDDVTATWSSPSELTLSTPIPDDRWHESLVIRFRGPILPPGTLAWLLISSLYDISQRPQNTTIPHYDFVSRIPASPGTEASALKFEVISANLSTPLQLTNGRTALALKQLGNVFALAN
ncbi:hypothetical protein ACLMJK_006954 [Lecanora helva]